MTETLKPPLTLEALRARRAEILALAARYGVSNVRVFGSVARGEATPTSDVDLLVTANAGTSIFDVVGLWLDLQELLGCRVNVITDGVEDQRFLQRVQTDAVAL
ncbi:MAG: nucleotidyltransferase family protein [Anaerolinea sp.]